MFGKEFWKQAVVVFTRMPMDLKAKNKRFKNTKQTDDELARKYMKVKKDIHYNLTYLFYYIHFVGGDGVSGREKVHKIIKAIIQLFIKT